MQKYASAKKAGYAKYAENMQKRAKNRQNMLEISCNMQKI